MTDHCVQAVLFDVGGLLVTQRLDVTSFMPLLGLNPSDPVDVDYLDKAIWSHRDQHDLGIRDQEFWASVALDLGIDIPRGTVLDTLVQADVERMNRPEAAALEVVDVLKAAGLTVGILANAPLCVATSIRQADWAQQRFDHFFFSSDYSVRKPHSSIYQAAVQGLSLDPAHILFIDDRAKHVRGAQYVGMDGLLWESPEQAMAELTQRGIL